MDCKFNHGTLDWIRMILETAVGQILAPVISAYTTSLLLTCPKARLLPAPARTL